MFEQNFEDMTASVFVEHGIFQTLTASNVGLGNCGIKEGANLYTSTEAIHIIHKIDSRLPACPKSLQKRIRATRMQFVFAFGPDMEEALTR